MLRITAVIRTDITTDTIAEKVMDTMKHAHIHIRWMYQALVLIMNENFGLQSIKKERRFLVTRLDLGYTPQMDLSKDSL